MPKVHCKALKTIGSHKVYHITTANQLLVECESSIPSPTDMGKPTLTIVDQSLIGAVKIQKKNPKNMKHWHTSFVSHIIPICVKKLELQQPIYSSLHKYEQRGRRFIALKANVLDHDYIQGKHCQNGQKFGTWVHLGMTMNLHIGSYKSC